MTLFEINHLFAEERAQIGPRPAQEPLDLARAVARFGTSRGTTDSSVMVTLNARVRAI